VTDHLDVPRLTRRALLLGGVGAAATYAATSGVAATPGTRFGASVQNAATRSRRDVHLAATDGWVSIADPSKAPAIAPFWPDPLAAGHGPFDLFVFGFRDVTGLSAAQVSAQRGRAQISAPQLAFDEGTEVRITLSNLGLSQRPDLVDGHTMHWHGFVNAIPLFDGVPELSLSVPIGREFTYFYIPRDAGTYMYHCHFEDVEHVQMGMTGALFVRPAQNVTGWGGLPLTTKYAYNDGDGTTRYDREFGFMLSEIFAEGHYRDAHIQTTDWTDFKASFSTMNGRTYPDTLVGNGSRSATGDMVAADAAGRLQYQPITSLVTCNAGDRVLLRLSSLGYLNHAMTVDNLDLTVVAKDASLLRGAGGANQYLHTNTIDLGPGESRDVIFTAPDFSASRPVSQDGGGRQYNSYLLYDRDYRGAGNAGGPNPGGMMTQIRVYPPGTLGAQADPQTMPNA